MNEFKDLLVRDEPIPPFNERFQGKLESILESVNQTFESKYLNPTILDAAASYFNQFIRGHSFKNGNKRLAVLYTHWFLLKHNITFTLTTAEMRVFAVFIAQASERNISAEQTKIFCKEIISKYTKPLDI